MDPNVLLGVVGVGGTLAGTGLGFLGQFFNLRYQTRRDDMLLVRAEQMAESARARSSQKQVIANLIPAVQEMFDKAAMVSRVVRFGGTPEADQLVSLRDASKLITVLTYQLRDSQVSFAVRLWAGVLIREFSVELDRGIPSYDFLYDVLHAMKSEFSEHLGTMWRDLDMDREIFRQLPESIQPDALKAALGYASPAAGKRFSLSPEQIAAKYGLGLEKLIRDPLLD